MNNSESFDKKLVWSSEWAICLLGIQLYLVSLIKIYKWIVDYQEQGDVTKQEVSLKFITSRL